MSLQDFGDTETVTTTWTAEDGSHAHIGREWRLMLWRGHAVSVRYKPPLYGAAYSNLGVDVAFWVGELLSVQFSLVYWRVTLEYRTAPFPNKRP